MTKPDPLPRTRPKSDLTKTVAALISLRVFTGMALSPRAGVAPRAQITAANRRRRMKQLPFWRFRKDFGNNFLPSGWGSRPGAKGLWTGFGCLSESVLQT